MVALFAVSRLDSNAAIPDWVIGNSFYSIHRTGDELSIVCDESMVPAETKSERNWRVLKVEGPLDFGMTGVLASIAHPLAEARISIFVLSTFDTDYILIKTSNLEQATASLEQAGFTVEHSKTGIL